MDVTATYNTQWYFTLVNALQHAVEREYQQRQDGVDPTLWNPQPTRAYECSHNLMPHNLVFHAVHLPKAQPSTKVWPALKHQLIVSHPAPPYH